jgi:cell division GTPase FtsZ
LEVPKTSIFLLESGGTGRDPKVGEQIAKANKDSIIEFLSEQFPMMYEGGRVVVCIGGGGGSGAGMMTVILDWLVKNKADILLVYTLPEKREGLPAKPNALKTLNKVISRYLERDRITALVIDNDYVVDKYGSRIDWEQGSYWAEVNLGIVRSLLRFWYLTNLDMFTNFIDVTSGYGALDERELMRVMYTKGGFLDLREFVAEDLDLENAKAAKFKSLVFGNLDIGTAKSYIVTVGFPHWMRNDPRVSEFLDIIFKKLARITKTTFVLRSSHFNKKLTDVRVNVLLSGLVKSHGLKKIINQTVKDVEKYNDKGGIEKLDLSEVDF